MPMPFNNTNWDRENGLYIDLRTVGGLEIKIGSWPDGLPISIRRNNVWEEFKKDPGFALVVPEHEHDYTLPVNRLISGIPKDIRQAVKPISYLQFSLLQYSCQSRQLQELLLSSPILAWFIVCKLEMENWSVQYKNKLLCNKQRDILNVVAGVSEKADIKFLRKVELLNGTKQEQGIVISALQEPSLKRSVRNLQSVPVALLAILLKLPFLRESSMIPFIIEEGNFINVGDALSRLGTIETCWNDGVRLAQTLNFDAESALRSCRTEGDLWHLHGRWCQRINDNEELLAVNDEEFPDPPFADTDDIKAIRTPGELFTEGRDMHHCVAAYAQEVLTGQCYIYRVLQPDRATLELRMETGQWQIGQFKLANNEEPCQESKECVMGWLKQG